jgi:hypothetical protein
MTATTRAPAVRQLIAALFLLFGVPCFEATSFIPEISKAAEQGDAKAQFNLGGMFRSGFGAK